MDDAATQPALHRRHPAKKLVVLVGSTKAIGQAVRVTGAGRSHTALDYRLTERTIRSASIVRAANKPAPAG